MPGSKKKAADKRAKQNAGKAPSIEATTVLTRNKQCVLIVGIHFSFIDIEQTIHRLTYRLNLQQPFK